MVISDGPQNWPSRALTSPPEAEIVGPQRTRPVANAHTKAITSDRRAVPGHDRQNNSHGFARKFARRPTAPSMRHHGPSGLHQPPHHTSKNLSEIAHVTRPFAPSAHPR